MEQEEKINESNYIDCPHCGKSIKISHKGTIKITKYTKRQILTDNKKYS